MRAFITPASGVTTIESAEIAIPQIDDDDELLVRVKTIGVGIQDPYFLTNDVRNPFTIGMEAAGVVKASGKDVHAYREATALPSSISTAKRRNVGGVHCGKR